MITQELVASTAKDQSKAIAYYRRAAELGHVAAYNRLRKLPEKK